MIPLFFAIGAQGRGPFSLSASFLDTGGFPFKIQYLIGHFLNNCDQLFVGGGESAVV